MEILFLSLAVLCVAITLVVLALFIELVKDLYDSW